MELQVFMFYQPYQTSKKLGYNHRTAFADYRVNILCPYRGGLEYDPKGSHRKQTR
ncbi:MAG: hypothetical protein ACK41Q_08765 [Candidatus Brocadia sp.]